MLKLKIEDCKQSWGWSTPHYGDSLWGLQIVRRNRDAFSTNLLGRYPAPPKIEE